MSWCFLVISVSYSKVKVHVSREKHNMSYLILSVGDRQHSVLFTLNMFCFETPQGKVKGVNNQAVMNFKNQE